MTTPASSVSALLALLQHERERMLDLYASIPAPRRAQAAVHGAQDWSAAQIVEHCSRVEGNVARMIAKGAELPLTATAEELQSAVLTEKSIGWVRERATKVEAPERVHPTGTLDADTALAQLQASRVALLEAFAAADAEVLDRIVFPHPFLGPLTLRSWTELVAHHDARHTQQMAELLPP